LNATVVELQDLALSERNWLFQGKDHGSSITFFVNRHPPGDGPPAHRHPYDETFIVQDGEATFTVDGEQLIARAGQIVVVPAGAVHSYINSGPGVLQKVDIQPSPEMIVEWLSAD
jgi:quercetin dioxygenase-like cupin family protein